MNYDLLYPPNIWCLFIKQWSYLILIIVVLYGAIVELKNKLQTLQNRAARIITRYGYEVRSSEILSSLGWCDLETRRKRQKSILMYKINKGIVLEYLQELFLPVVNAHNHNARNCDINCKIPQPNTDYLKRSLSYDGALLWNSLPLAIRKISNINNYTNNYIYIYIRKMNNINNFTNIYIYELLC